MKVMPGQQTLRQQGSEFFKNPTHEGQTQVTHMSQCAQCWTCMLLLPLQYQIFPGELYPARSSLALVSLCWSPVLLVTMQDGHVKCENVIAPGGMEQATWEHVHYKYFLVVIQACQRNFRFNSLLVSHHWCQHLWKAFISAEVSSLLLVKGNMFSISWKASHKITRLLP